MPSLLSTFLNGAVMPSFFTVRNCPKRNGALANLGALNALILSPDDHRVAVGSAIGYGNPDVIKGCRNGSCARVAVWPTGLPAHRFSTPRTTSAFCGEMGRYSSARHSPTRLQPLRCWPPTLVHRNALVHVAQYPRGAYGCGYKALEHLGETGKSLFWGNLDAVEMAGGLVESIAGGYRVAARKLKGITAAMSRPRCLACSASI